MVESETASDLAHNIHMHFVTNQFHWGHGEEEFTPSPEEIEDGLQFVKERLAQEPDGTTMFAGRFAIQKSAGHLDVFVHFGEIDNDNSV